MRKYNGNIISNTDTICGVSYLTYNRRFIMSLKSRIRESKVMSRGRYDKPLESNPRDSEGTILGDMENILRLVEQNEQLRRERNVKQ